MRHHHSLSLDERIEIRVGRSSGMSVRGIGRLLNRSASTISREVRRVAAGSSVYHADIAHKAAVRLRRKARVPRKLGEAERWQSICEQLRQGWSPQQISNKLCHQLPVAGDFRVSTETIYKAIYLVPRGALRKALIGCLRQGRSTRKPRTRGVDRRGQLPNMQSIHIRPPEVEARQVPGHWEGDLIKGAGNRSSIGTLVERKTGFVVLARMTSAQATDVLEGFAQAFAGVPKVLCKTMTYDQGKEMSYHAALTRRTGLAIYFADPHSPWQRGSNENTNGLLRQYLPKGENLAVYSQDQLNEIALRLNTRPRRRLDWRTPLEVYTEIIQLDQSETETEH